MAEVIQGQRKGEVRRGNPIAGQFGKVGTLFGGLVGGAVGGPGGAMAGASAGGAIGNMIGNSYGRSAIDEVVAPPSAPTVSTNSDSAMQRRMVKIQQDPYEAIKQANLALEYAPKEIRDTYKAPLNEALSLAYKEQSAGRIG